MKKKKISLIGGFHNSPIVNVMVNARLYEDYKNGCISLSDILSDNQEKKLDQHFCGIKGCICGSYARAEIVDVDELFLKR